MKDIIFTEVMDLAQENQYMEKPLAHTHTHTHTHTRTYYMYE
jgi:hypothetical protein